MGFNRRWCLHKRELVANIHINKHLQFAWNKYGADTFEFRIIEECADDVLVNREQVWMDHYDSRNREKGYNIRGAGSRGEINEETRKKLSLALSGKKHSRVHTTNQALTTIGRKVSEETKVKLRAFTGEKSSFFGKNHSEETKIKMSSAKSGRSPSFEHRQKLSEALVGEKSPWFGKNHSDVTKEKIKLAAKQHWEKRKAEKTGGVI